MFQHESFLCVGASPAGIRGYNRLFMYICTKCSVCKRRPGRVKLTFKVEKDGSENYDDDDEDDNDNRGSDVSKL